MIRELHLGDIGAPKRGARGLLSALLGCLIILSCVLCTRSWADRAPDTFLESEEGRRVVAFWQTMTDHSSGAVYAPTQFQTMAGKLDGIRKDLKALGERRVIPEAVAEQLRWILHMRYGYIRESHYSTRSTIHVTDAEAARSAAQWVIEFQLGVLRKPVTCKAEGELQQMAVRNIDYQLTFLSHLDTFEAEADRRRIALQEREDHGETVDMAAFEAECAKKRIALLDAYRDRKIPNVKPVEQVLPYVVALAQAKPAPQTIAGGPTARPNF